MRHKTTISCWGIISHIIVTTSPSSSQMNSRSFQSDTQTRDDLGEESTERWCSCRWWWWLLSLPFLVFIHLSLQVLLQAFLSLDSPHSLSLPSYTVILVLLENVPASLFYSPFFSHEKHILLVLASRGWFWWREKRYFLSWNHIIAHLFPFNTIVWFSSSDCQTSCHCIPNLSEKTWVREGNASLQKNVRKVSKV